MQLFSEPNFDEIPQKPVRFFTGKGGVGKSHCALLYALYQARVLNKKVCLVQCTDFDPVSKWYDIPSIGHRSVEIEANLFSENISHHENFRDFVAHYLGFEALFEKVFKKKLVKSFIDLLPGLSEIVLLGRLYFLAEEKKDPYDLVVFDGYSSGHFLKLIQTPTSVMQAKLLGQVEFQTKKISDYLFANSATTLVSLPDPIVVSETKDLLLGLDKETLTHCDSLILNRYWPIQSLNKGLVSRTPHIATYLAQKSQTQTDACHQLIGLIHGRIESGHPVSLLKVFESISLDFKSKDLDFSTMIERVGKGIASC